MGTECRTVCDGAGVICLTALAKFEVVGKGAEVFFDSLLATTLPAGVGDVADGLMLNAQGGIGCRVTVTRLAPDRFYLCAPGVAEGRHLDWPMRRCPASGVASDRVRERLGAFLAAAPRARWLLSRLTGARDPNDAFPLMTAHHANLTFAKSSDNGD